MRIHALENVQKAIDFLREKKVPMENIGNHDIVDGNHRIILGLIWTIILRFQVSFYSGKLTSILWMFNTLLLGGEIKLGYGIDTNTEHNRPNWDH